MKITEEGLRKAAWATLAIGMAVLFMTVKLGRDTLLPDAKRIPSLCSSGRQVITGSVESVEVNGKYTVFRINVPVRVLARNSGKSILGSPEIREGVMLIVEGNAADRMNMGNKNTEGDFPVIFADRIYLKDMIGNRRSVSILR